MAFKIKRSIPLLFEGTIDPGKKLETPKPDPYKTNQRGFSSYSIDKDKKTVEDHKSYDPSKHSKVRNFFESIGPGRAKDRLDTVKSNTPPSVTSKVDAKQQFDKTISTSGIGSGKDDKKTKPKKTGGYVKKGGTSTGNIKDYKAGTEARRNEYTARGWKQDSTTKINKDSTTPEKPTAEVIKTKGVSIGVKAPKASDVNLSKKPNVKKEGLNKKTNYSKIAVTEKDAARRIKRGKKSSARKEESMKRKAGRIDKAKASGNTNKVDRIKESARRKKARVDAKKKKGNS
jgi:hypothetical protein